MRSGTTSEAHERTAFSRNRPLATRHISHPGIEPGRDRVQGGPRAPARSARAAADCGEGLGWLASHSLRGGAQFCVLAVNSCGRTRSALRPWVISGAREAYCGIPRRCFIILRQVAVAPLVPNGCHCRRRRRGLRHGSVDFDLP